MWHYVVVPSEFCINESLLLLLRGALLKIVCMAYVVLNLLGAITLANMHHSCSIQ